MTQTGINRAHYAESHAAQDPRPSRFSEPGAYGEWAARADLWAARDNVRDLLKKAIDDNMPGDWAAFYAACDALGSNR